METLITAALTAIATSPGAKKAGQELSNAVWTDFLRPLFLKDDPETGKVIAAKIEAEPAAPSNQQLIREKLEQHLVGNPNAISKLQELLPGAAGGSQLIDNKGAVIGKQINITNNTGDLNF